VDRLVRELDALGVDGYLFETELDALGQRGSPTFP
jgi:hypothetical protein